MTEGESEQAETMLTVAICTYDRYEYLKASIDSVVHQAAVLGGAVEILVIDNSPRSDQRDAWEVKYSDHPLVRYITVDTPGLSNARNVAVSKARGDYVIFLDDDAVALEGWAKAYLTAFEQYPDTRVAGGPIYPNFEAPRPRWLHHDLLAYLTVVDWKGKTRYLPKSQWVAGANIAFHRQSYRRAGGCSVSLGRNGASATLLSNEETELIERINGTSHQVLYVVDARVSHCVPKSRLSHAWFRKRIMWQAISDQIAGKGDVLEAAEREKSLLRYISVVPAEHRSLRAFFFDTDDPDLFLWQVQALYGFVQTTLGAGELFAEPP